MDSNPMPAGALWRLSELMIIQVPQPTKEIPSLLELFRRFHRRNHVCSCWKCCMSPSCGLLL